MDFAILYGIQQAVGCPFMDAIMPAITTLGSYGLLWITVGIILLIPAKTRRWGLTLLITMGITWAICEFGVKEIIARPRPFMVDTEYALLINPPGGFSMPSGHTLTAFLAATVIAAAPIARGWKASAWVIAALIGFSRMYLFVHFPSDVLMGALIGVAAGLAGIWASNKIAAAA